MAWVEKRGPWYRVRYRDADGTVCTTPDKYRVKRDATEAAEEIETDTRHGRFINPADARTSLTDWAATWRKAHRVAPSTKAKYDHHLDLHILPAFGTLGLDSIRRLAVKQWADDLGDRYAPSTVASIVTLLSVLLSAAAEERLIAHNPVQGLRLAGTHAARPPGGRRARQRPIPEDRHLRHLLQRVGHLGGRNAQIMVITAAWTGMRWGELAGLARGNCHTGHGHLLVDPEVGSLHEVGGRMWLGPPKSEAAARRIDLPPFLVDLLDEAMDAHDHQQVFVSPEGQWLRRSNFSRRVWRPACDGRPDPEHPELAEPVLPRAVFHGLRHHHKTILDELDLPEVLKHERMGHEMKGIQGVYSHVTPPMRRTLTNRLQRRWRAQR